MIGDAMNNKLMSAKEAVARIKDKSTIAITGSGGGLVEPDFVYAALESRFLETGFPRDMTLVHAFGLGDRASRGQNRFAHEGLVRRVISGHWGWTPTMQALGRDNKIEAYALPSGVISLLFREIGAKRPGLFTHVGLGTYVDPRQDGGKMNAAATEDLVELVEIAGKEYLHYKPFNVDVGIVRGTFADEAGNIAMTGEPADLDVYAVALAAHNSGGMVIAQVREVVRKGSLPPRSICIPGVLVDAVVVVPEQKQTYRELYDVSLSGEARSVRDFLAGKAPEEPVKRILARRAALELKAGQVLNFGFGASAIVATMIAQAGDQDKYWTTIEQGIYGGHMVDDELFGMAHNPTAIIDSPSQFDFYSGGGLDMTFLGMAEMDGEGNVNVSSLNGTINGPGGFIDISQNAKKVVFCGTFDAKGSDIAIEKGKLKIRKPGKIRKLLKKVSHITFSGAQARKFGQSVYYVTERATFRLVDNGIELVDVAPGVDIQKDVLDQMDFMPIINQVGIYPEEVMA